MSISKIYSFLTRNKVLRFILTGCIFVAIVAAVICRFSLFSMSFEYDELFTAVTSDPVLSLGWIWSNWLVPDVHPPLHNVLLWVYNHWMPYGPEFWLRLPSVILGVGALACGWWLFPRRFGKTARLIFVSLLACHQYMILYSQHARAYALMLFLSVLLTFWFLDISRRIWHGKRIAASLWAKYALAALFLSWSHYFGTLLVGIFYILLFLQAWRYKQNLKPFIVLPVITGLLFLPWIIPNFLAQLQIHRFEENNWWANRDASWYMVKSSLRFFVFSRTGIAAFAVLVAGGAVGQILQRVRGRLCPFARERLLLVTAVLAVAAVTSLISFKIFLFIGRYFTPILPALFLWVALITARVVRKNNLFRAVLLVLLVAEVWTFTIQRKALLNPTMLPARLVSQFYYDFFRGREVMVLAVEAFPPRAMPAMYGYYIHKVYGVKADVTELVHLNPQERERVLARNKDAFVFMPNCEEWKLRKVADQWNKHLNIYGNLGSVCLLFITDQPETPPAGPKPIAAVK